MTRFAGRRIWIIIYPESILEQEVLISTDTSSPKVNIGGSGSKFLDEKAGLFKPPDGF